MIGPCEVLTPEGPAPLGASITRAIAPACLDPLTLDPHPVLFTPAELSATRTVLGVPLASQARVLLEDGSWRAVGDMGAATLVRTWDADSGIPGQAEAGEHPAGDAEVHRIDGQALVRMAGSPWIAVGGAR